MSTPYELLVRHFQQRYPRFSVTERLQSSRLRNEFAVRQSKAIIIAAHTNNDEAILLSVRAGEDPNVEVSDLYGHTRALILGVIQAGNIDTVRCLVELGADVNHRRTVTPLFKACYAPNPRDMVAALLELGADPNICGALYPGETALGAAISSHRDDPALVDVLIIQGGADPRLLTAKQIARAKPACLRSLLEMYCVAPDAGQGYGKTPLSFACKFESRCSEPSDIRERIDVLLAAGADPNLVDERYRHTLPNL